MNEWTMTHIDEPMLSFGFNQQTEHPKDGLFLYGPHLPPIKTPPGWMLA
jgi:hypothetical protein